MRRGLGTIELLVAAALLAVLLTLLWRVNSASARADAQIDRVAGAALARAALWTRLARDLDCAAPEALTGAPPVRLMGDALEIVRVTERTVGRVVWRIESGRLLRDGLPVGPPIAQGTLSLRDGEVTLAWKDGEVTLPVPARALCGWVVHPSHRRAL